MGSRFRCSNTCTLACAAWALHCAPATRVTESTTTPPSYDAAASFSGDGGATNTTTLTETASAEAASNDTSDSGNVDASHLPQGTDESSDGPDASVPAVDGTPKLDLLLVIDSSPSMGEKSRLFAASVRGMLRK